VYVDIIDKAAILFALFAGSRETGDIERYADSIVRVGAMADAQGRGALAVLLYEAGSSSGRGPGRAVARRREAAGPNLLIVVAPSPASWLSPSTLRWRSIVCESFADALIVAGAFRPGSVEVLEQMNQQLAADPIVRRARSRTRK
jgi:hypothetical protein